MLVRFRFTRVFYHTNEDIANDFTFASVSGEQQLVQPSGKPPLSPFQPFWVGANGNGAGVGVNVPKRLTIGRELSGNANADF